ncbi:MAG: hypothetical protein RIQ94_2643 [Pseudomonadota bacterium]|jgi:uncharacterized protein (DUF4415 family)
MQKEYDLTKLKVKRRGLLTDLPPQNETHTQMECVLLLDKEVVEFFQKAATQPNALPYQVQINQLLREIIKNTPRTADTV